MNYNIHPIFVRFPIALLFVYSLIKILPLKRWVPSIAWKDIERILLLIGVLGAFVGLSTGETAEHILRPNHQLVEMHSTFAALSTWVYAALLGGEIAMMINAKQYVYGTQWTWVGSLLRLIERVICNRAVGVVLAVVGLVAISVTGMLGGIITYGVTADPIAPLLLKALGITL